ncbi:hypothetical protein [Microbacterium tumbae]
MPKPKSFIWIIREDSTRGHLSHVVAALDGQASGSLDDVRILTVAPHRPVTVPDGYRLITGEPVPEGEMTDDDLPKQGLLLVAA